MAVERLLLQLDEGTCRKVAERARRYDKSINLIIVEACRHLIGEEQRGREPVGNGSRLEALKGGPKDVTTLPGWPTPKLQIEIGAEKTWPKLVREAKKRPLEEVVIEAIKVWLGQPNPLGR